MISIHRAGDRYETRTPGITTRHCFASGAHYDPANLRFGAVIALDEHVLEPGAGFAEHAHRGVELISWVLDGTLRHEDPSGRVELIRPGTLQHQVAGTGIRHSEANASASEPLRFVQLWLDLPGTAVPPAYALVAPPLAGLAAYVAVLRPRAPIILDVPGWALLLCTRGTPALDGAALEPGDSARLREASARIAGSGELLVISGAAAPARVAG